MAPLRILRRWIVRFRAQRWSKEALLAVVLTLAAATFIAAALMGNDGGNDGGDGGNDGSSADKAPVTTADKPQK